MTRMPRRYPTAGLFLTALLLAGCTREGRFQAISMWNQSRLKPLEASPMPDVPSSSRPLVPGTVARGELSADDPISSGWSGGKLVTTIPLAVTPEVLERGQLRFTIYCTPCHGRLGNGQGMVVQRGFPPPPDYAIRRLRNAPVGHFFDVITNGYGVMYSYASRVPPRDRWAIAAYIRVLQASRVDASGRPEIPPEMYREKRLRARQIDIGAAGRIGGEAPRNPVPRTGR
jgi:mono/diheme cytochrome c family protein